ncbi:3272_t:CDS:2 [Cetraspora pellucida]|uniref:3272_t:CDS:1 n=1 Tax=Cetraspora pellucida TaxID=1433469 RepID=A0A9N9FB79_9GLOM|nr:3272_t:CDS:2 [Cetraspora pellucida]
MSHRSQSKQHESISKGDFPNPFDDEEEIINTRLYMHSFYEYLFNGNVGAPVHEKLRNGAKALEFRCNDGIWSSEVAAEYPNSEFYAVDSIVSKFNDELNNITFIGCDISKKLPFPDDEFDYIFSDDRFLLMEKRTFQEVLLEIFRILKPGGWLETQNIDYDTVENLENYLQETEKTESILYRIEETKIGNGHTSGEFLLQTILLFYRNSRDLMTSFMNISSKEFDDLLKNLESELNVEDSKITLRHKQVLAKKRSAHSEISHTVSSTK